MKRVRRACLSVCEGGGVAIVQVGTGYFAEVAYFDGCGVSRCTPRTTVIYTFAVGVSVRQTWEQLSAHPRLFRLYG